MDAKEAKKIAKQIARDLFTSGDNDRRADNLKMYQGDRYLGGWAEYALASRIEKHLNGELKKKGGA